MMKPLPVLFVAMAMLLLFTTAFAEGYDDCMQSCAANRDTRNTRCPSDYDSYQAGQDRRECINSSQTAYKVCITQCSATPDSSSDEQAAPAAMGGY